MSAVAETLASVLLIGCHVALFVLLIWGMRS